MSHLTSCIRCAQSVVVSLAIILVLFHQTCSAKHRRSCPSSSCGEIRDIKYPFRLKGDPGGCGLPSYEFDCVNNRTLLTLFSGKYYVKEIDYNRYKIRMSDAGVVEDTSCTFPRNFLSTRNFSVYDNDPLTIGYCYFPAKVRFLNCSNRVSDDPRYVEVKAGGCDSGGVIYAVLDSREVIDKEFTVMDVKVGCRLKIATFANWTHDRNVSYADILKSLEEGFWLSWLPLVCRDYCGKGISCSLNQTTQQIECAGCEMFNHPVSNCGEIYYSS